MKLNLDFDKYFGEKQAIPVRKKADSSEVTSIINLRWGVTFAGSVVIGVDMPGRVACRQAPE